MPDDTPTLDAAARDELARKLEASNKTVRFLLKNMVGPGGLSDAAPVILLLRAQERMVDDALALLSAAQREEAETRDAERYRFLRDNPLQLRAIDGNASFRGQWSAEHFDEFTDVAMLQARMEAMEIAAALSSAFPTPPPIEDAP